MPHGLWETSPTGELIPIPANCPYGQPGDQLWVREAWRTVAESDTLPPRDLTPAHRIWYESDESLSALRGLSGQGKLRPSMFMPRWASRITLEITGVRVERLQDISGADALAEGVRIPCNEARHPLLRITDNIKPDQFTAKTPREWSVADFARFEYAILWQSINGPGSWASNPWVWVVEFKRVQQP